MPAPYQGRPSSSAVEAYPELAGLKAAVAARNWSAITDFFDNLTNADEIALAASLGVDGEGAGRSLEGVERFFQDMSQDWRHGSLAQLLLAHRLVDLAWEARTGERAKHVSREQFNTFFAYLRQAEGVLLDLTAREPANVPAWTVRITTARGLELGQAEARRRYNQVARVERHSFEAQSLLLQQLAPKWGGSFDQMDAFARECVAAAPQGSHCGAIIAEAHIEHWLELPDREAEDYLRQPEVQHETAAAAARSVLHPMFRPGLGSIGAHNAFAFVFSLGGNPRDAAPHFRAVGNSCRGPGWGYLNDPAAFDRYRAAALGGMR